MPYIKKERRPDIDPWIQALANSVGDDPGELNYSITRLVVLWIAKFGGVRYSRIATVTGVLKNIADEFYACVARKYEARKEAENGPVYQEIL
jgi:hypothetical protein